MTVIRSSTRDFPPELIDAIMEHLSDDVKTLKLCSLASTIFVHSARARLFHSVDISVKNRPHELAKTAPHLISHIRQLSITGFGWIGKQPWLSDDKELPHTLDAFSKYGSCQVQTVSLRRIPWQRLSSDTQLSLQSLLACKSVLHVQLLSCYVPSTIFDHVSSRLMTLDMHCGIVPSADNVSTSGDLTEPDIYLESLTLKTAPDAGLTVNFFLNDLGRRFDISGLRVLSLYIQPNWAAFEPLFKKTSPGVEQLTLTIIPTALRGDSPLDLGQFPLLEHLILNPICDIFLDKFVKWLTASLSHLNAKNILRSITVCLCNRSIADHSTWTELDSLFSGPLFKSGKFRQLLFKQSTEDTAGFYKTADSILSSLPRMSSRGLLQVERPTSSTLPQPLH